MVIWWRWCVGHLVSVERVVDWPYRRPGPGCGIERGTEPGVPAGDISGAHRLPPSCMMPASSGSGIGVLHLLQRQPSDAWMGVCWPSGERGRASGSPGGGPSRRQTVQREPEASRATGCRRQQCGQYSIAGIGGASATVVPPPDAGGDTQLSLRAASLACLRGRSRRRWRRPPALDEISGSVMGLRPSRDRQ